MAVLHHIVQQIMAPAQVLLVLQALQAVVHQALQAVVHQALQAVVLQALQAVVHPVQEVQVVQEVLQVPAQ